MTDAAAVHALLLETRSTLATAESLTGGLLGATFTSVPGASATYLGGVISYVTDVKVSVLGVPASIVEAEGVVSGACAIAMANGVRDLTGATFAVSTTGVAGPDQQEGKAVGTVFVGLAGPNGSRAVALTLTGDRAQIRERTCVEAVSVLGAMIVGNNPATG